MHTSPVISDIPLGFTSRCEKLLDGVLKASECYYYRSNAFYPGSGTWRDNWDHTHNTMARGGVCQGSSKVEKP